MAAAEGSPEPAVVRLLVLRPSPDLTARETAVQAALRLCGGGDQTAAILWAEEGLWTESRVSPTGSTARRGRTAARQGSCYAQLRVIIADDQTLAVARARAPSPTGARVKFAYGPTPEQSTSTAGQDLLWLLRSLARYQPHCFGAFSDLTRAEPMRVLWLVCPTPLTRPQLNLVAGLLCHAKGAQRLNLSSLTQGFSMEQRRRPLPPVPAPDPVGYWACGIFRNFGQSGQFTLCQPAAAVLLSQPCRRLALPVSVDFFVPQVTLWQDQMSFPHGHLSRANGAAYHRGCFSAGPSALDGLVNDPRAWYGPIFQAYQMGLVFKQPPAHVRRFEEQEEHVKLDQFLAVLLATRRCTGRPTLQGFLSLHPADASPVTWSSPVAYQGYMCLAQGSPGAAQSLHCRDAVCIYMLGGSLSWTTHSDYPFMHHESGRDLGSVAEAVSAIMAIFPPSYVLGISAVNVLSSLHAKIYAVCGGGAYSMSSETKLLPAFVRDQLKPFCTKNNRSNRRVLDRCFFQSCAPVTLLALRHDEEGVSQAVAEDICSFFGCPLRAIGLRTEGPHIKIYDTYSLTHPSCRALLWDICPPLVMAEAPAKEPVTLVDNPQVEQAWITFPLVHLLPKILEHPSVACKDFIVKHMDRCSSGRVARQPGVGPRDVPLADYAIIVGCAVHPSTPAVPRASQNPRQPPSNPPGVCSALGERNLLSCYYPVYGAVTAIAEALLSLCLAPITDLRDVVISLALSYPVSRSVCERVNILLTACHKFCSVLGVNMMLDSAVSSTGPHNQKLHNPQFTGLVATASSICPDVSLGLTPDLKRTGSVIFWLPVSKEKLLFASVAQQVTNFGKPWGKPVDILPSYLRHLCSGVLQFKREGFCLSGHDVSDGGVFAALFEMAVAGHRSLKVSVSPNTNLISFLASETPALLLEVPGGKSAAAIQRLTELKIVHRVIAKTVPSLNSPTLSISQGGQAMFEKSLASLKEKWSTFSITRELLTRPEGETVLCDQDYGNNEVSVALPFSQVISPAASQLHVLVYVFPGNAVPEALMGALSEAGFTAHAVSVSFSPSRTLATDLDKICGFCLVGSPNLADDNDLGPLLMSQFVKGKNSFAREIQTLLSNPKVFSLALGATACETLFHFDAILPEPGAVCCKRNVSKKYESRWLNIYIPPDTSAVAFQSLKGSLVSAWVQGLSLGFTCKGDTTFEKLQALGSLASMYYGANMHAGPAASYPRNPAAGFPAAGLCSEDGRHLGLLFDPSLSRHLWQWPHVPENLKGQTSPWKRMFSDLALWAISQKPYC